MRSPLRRSRRVDVQLVAVPADFVTLRVALRATIACPIVVEAVQSALGEDTGIQGRLLRRSDDPSTWMEIYEAVADPPRFEAALERLLAQHGFEACLAPDSRRHSERFTPFGSSESSVFGG